MSPLDPLQPSPGMIFQQCPLEPGGRRIIVQAVLNRSRWRPSVQVTNLDGSRRRWLKASNLHFDSTNRDGEPRRGGYVFVRLTGGDA